MEAPLLYKLILVSSAMASAALGTLCIRFSRKIRTLSDSNRLYIAACRTAGSAIWQYLPSRETVTLSPEWFTLTSRDPASFPGLTIPLDSFLGFVHPDDSRSFRVFIENLATTGRKRRFFSYRLSTGNGCWVQLKCMAAAIEPEDSERPDGEDVSVIALEHDASREARHFLRLRNVYRNIRKLRKSSRQAEYDAELSVKAKTQFLATMSHEIRTPINVIIGFSQILAEDRYLSEVHKETLDIIQKSSDHLLSLINGILDWSRIESGNFRINMETIHLPSFVNDISALFGLKEGKRNVELVVENSPDLPEFIETDPLRLRQICMNLLSNAMKFTTKGSVTFKTRSILQGDKCSLIFDVIDTGIGIKELDNELIFKAFSQCSGVEKMSEGTGLGLFISKKIVNELGGDITFASTEGKGSHFSFTIPANLSSAQQFCPNTGASDNRKQARSSQEHAGTTGMQILVVDDNPATLRLLKQQLGRIGFQVDTAENGKDALARWMQKDYCAVLTDCSMPVMDGFDLSKAIRLHEIRDRSQRIPIIALTGSVEEYREKCAESGIDTILGKPFHYEELKKVVNPLMHAAP